MKVRVVCFLAAVLTSLVGCSSTPAATGSYVRAGSACRSPDGLYKQHMEEKSGTCGAATDSLVGLGSAATSSGSSCSGSASYDDVKCADTLNLVCSGVRMTGYVDWNEDGTKGEGEVSVTGYSCSSIYRITYTKER